ncbi:hypothetical protein GQ43DRAFT_171911 [Delitschia confertaspora ATCC 74209]|uniref:Uncharacterized protein n=1 Tax=Delitschia confertaspora ATCC 74209 TaxID=1513339 RepID=A0A9P4JEZ2_9PLEO|nr:hypothetical protein GQ43DRAFT_171911 [Delitschia confertaspora ATCC 74209]
MNQRHIPPASAPSAISTSNDTGLLINRSKSKKKKGFSLGVIIGIVIGALVLSKYSQPSFSNTAVIRERPRRWLSHPKSPQK